MAITEDDILRSGKQLRRIKADLTALTMHSTPDLFAELANAAVGSETEQTDRGDDHQLRGRGTPSAVSRTGGSTLGARIFYRWSESLHHFVCNPKPKDRALQRKIFAAVVGHGGTPTALVAVLIGHFALPAGIAMIIATILIRLLGKPTRDELCATWKSSLQALPPKAVGRRRSKRK
jgi:hypothetical protein